MTRRPEQTTDEDAVAKRWAAVRIVLGWLQMVGAMTSLIVLVQIGAGAVTVAVVGVTALLVTLSLVLFRAK